MNACCDRRILRQDAEHIRAAAACRKGGKFFVGNRIPIRRLIPMRSEFADEVCYLCFQGLLILRCFQSVSSAVQHVITYSDCIILVCPFQEVAREYLDFIELYNMKAFMLFKMRIVKNKHRDPILNKSSKNGQ